MFRACERCNNGVRIRRREGDLQLEARRRNAIMKSIAMPITMRVEGRAASPRFRQLGKPVMDSSANASAAVDPGAVSREDDDARFPHHLGRTTTLPVAFGSGRIPTT